MKFILSDIEQKLLSLRDIRESGCWNYTGFIDGAGYGAMRISMKLYRVHRLAALIWNGEYPPGTIVCHKCDNPTCFNPEHLYFGTLKTNAQDMVSRQRGKNQFTPGQTRGSKHHGVVLSESDVVEIKRRIREEYKFGLLAHLANQYGVTIQEISRIKHGRAWGWLKCA